MGYFPIVSFLFISLANFSAGLCFFSYWLIEIFAKLSTNGCWYLFNHKRSPYLGCTEGGDFMQCKLLNCGCATAQLWFSSIIIQHGYEQHSCEVTLEWGGPGAGGLGVATWPPWCCTSTLLCSTQARQLPFYSSSQGNSLWWKLTKTYKSGLFLGRRDLTYREKSPALISDRSILMQTRTPNPHTLIGPKSTVLIGSNGAYLIGWWRCKWGYSCAAVIEGGRSSAHWLM